MSRGVVYDLGMSGASKVDGRSKLNIGQVSILELLYKYRFGSRQLIADSLDIKAGSSLHEKLLVLMKHGYISMRLEKRLKLLGTPAAYFLLPAGYRALQSLPGREDITNATIKASYNDKNVSQGHITHVLDVYRYTNLLKCQYPSLKIFTKRDMSNHDYFPSQPPDAFLSLATDDPRQPKRFFFDLVSDTTPRYILDRRIANYCQFFDEGGWEVTGSDLPTLLQLSEWGPAEKRIRRSVASQLSRFDMEELQVYTSTTSALTSSENAIWTSLDDDDRLIELSN